MLTAAISANSVQAAPATLAKTAATVALAKGATASTPTLTLIKGVLKIMAWTKTKMAIVAGVAMLLVAGTTTVVVKTISHPIRITADPVKVELPPGPRSVGLGRPVPDGVGPGLPVSRPNPNTRFAALTPEERVQQARRHLPESLEDLRK
jgi:hypothetical protein